MSQRLPALLGVCCFLLFAASVCAANPNEGKELADARARFNAAVKAGEYEGAVKLGAALVKKYPEAKSFDTDLFRAAKAATRKMKLEFAAKLYRLLLENYPETEHASGARSELVACYSHLRELKACIKQGKVNLAKEPNSKWAESWEFLIGQSQFRLWHFKDAKLNLEAFLTKYPNGKYAKHAGTCLGYIDPPWKTDEHGIVAYKGKYEKDIRLQAAIRDLPQRMAKGYKMLEERLGLDLSKHTNMVYIFEDAGNKSTGGLKAQTRVIGINNKPTVLIRYFTEHAVGNPRSYRNTVVHEMKHAGFQGVMGHPYDSLPKWVREGLALYGSDDVATRVNLVLCNEIIAGSDPMKVLDGIDDAQQNWQDYLEGALAIEWLESKKKGNVKEFCRRLVTNEDYRKILSDMCGVSYKEVLKEINAYCRKRVSAILGKGYPAFLAIKKGHYAMMRRGGPATRKWLDGGGKKTSLEWLKEYPDHPATPFARFCLARSLINAGHHDDGRKLLREILANDGLRCTLLDDAQLWLGISYNKQRDAKNARAEFGILLRDFSNSHSAKSVRGQLPPTGPVTE